jgi:aminopeptidase
LRKKGINAIVIEANFHTDPQSVAEGAILGLYKFEDLKTQKGVTKEKEPLKELHLCVCNQEEMTKLSAGVIVATCQNAARRLAGAYETLRHLNLLELPANIATPTYFVDQSNKMFHGIPKVKVIGHDVKWAEEKKMGSFLSGTCSMLQGNSFIP